MNASWEVIVKWGDKFGSSYSRSWGEGFSLSFPLNQEHEAFLNQHSLDASTLLPFPFRRMYDGKRWWRIHDVCDERMMRRSRRKNTFDSGIFTRVWCLASGAKTRVAGLLYKTFRLRFEITWLLSLANRRLERNSGSRFKLSDFCRRHQELFLHYWLF